MVNISGQQFSGHATDFQLDLSLEFESAIQNTNLQAISFGLKVCVLIGHSFLPCVLGYFAVGHFCPNIDF